MNKTRNTFLLLLTAFIWGIAFVAQSVGMKHVEPMTFIAARSFIAAVVLIPVIHFFGQKNVNKVHDRNLWIGGLCCGMALFIASALQQYGISYTTVGKAGFITALYIVIVPILGIFFKRKPGILVWCSVFLALIGLYFLCMTDSLVFSKGDTFVLLCALAFSVHILVIDHFSPKTDGIRMSMIQFLVTGVCALIPALIFEHPTFSSICAAAAPILYAGVLSSGAGYTLQIVAQKDYDPTVASLILSLESVFSVLAGWVILHQTLALRELFGCFLMFAAIILAQLPTKKTCD